jgi:salicylate hydroxylase
MLPFLAQGAAMAVEDAVALTRCLEPGDPLAGLARYERARLPRTAKVQAWSRRNAWLFHLPPAAAAGVFGAARLLDRGEPEPAQQRFDWLYGYDAGAAPL